MASYDRLNRVQMMLFIVDCATEYVRKPSEVLLSMGRGACDALLRHQHSMYDLPFAELETLEDAFMVGLCCSDKKVLQDVHWELAAMRLKANDRRCTSDIVVQFAAVQPDPEPIVQLLEDWLRDPAHDAFVGRIDELRRCLDEQAYDSRQLQTGFPAIA